MTKKTKTDNYNEINNDILTAIKYILETDIRGIQARPKTIQSFLRGAKSSPFYVNFYSEHKDICGKYPYLSLVKIKENLEKLVNDGLIYKSGLNYILTETKLEHEIDKHFLYLSKSKEYSEEYLLNLINWEENFKKAKKTTKINYIKTSDNWKYPADSKEEISLIKKLSKQEYYKILRGQSLVVPYMTIKAKTSKKYYPDIVMLTHNNRIAIIEVKPIKFMSNFYTIAKYIGLKEYAKKNNYICTMCDRNFNTFEYFKNKRVNKDIKKQFNYIIKKYKCFKQEHFNKMVEGFSSKRKTKIENDIHTLIIQEDLINYGRYEFDVKDLSHITDYL